MCTNEVFSAHPFPLLLDRNVHLHHFCTVSQIESPIQFDQSRYCVKLNRQPPMRGHILHFQSLAGSFLLSPEFRHLGEWTAGERLFFSFLSASAFIHGSMSMTLARKAPYDTRKCLCHLGALFDGHQWRAHTKRETVTVNCPNVRLVSGDATEWREHFPFLIHSQGTFACHQGSHSSDQSPQFSFAF